MFCNIVWGRGGDYDKKDVFIRIQNSIVCSKALVLLNCLNTSVHDCRKGFLQLMYVSGQLNSMLLVTETNHGLAYGRDVKVSFEAFYEVIFVAMITKTLLKHTPHY